MLTFLRRLSIALFLTLPLALPITAHAAKGKWTPGVNVTTAVAHVIDVTQTINQKLNYGYDENCFFGALVRKSGQVNGILPLDTGTSYLLVAAGDDNAQDVDIVLKDTAGRPVGQHQTVRTASGLVHLVQYTPTRSGNHPISVRLLKARVDGAFCALSVLRNDGFKIPLRNLAVAIGKCIVTCGAIAKAEGGARLHQSQHGGAGEFTCAVIGKIIDKGDSDGFVGSLEKGRHAFVMATDGDDQAVAFGLVDAGGKLVVGRAGQGFLKYPTQSKTYGLAIANNTTREDLLAVAAVIDLPPSGMAKKR